MNDHYPPKPITLKGKYVQLLPLSFDHVKPLQEAVQDGSLWKLWYTFIPTAEKMEEWITTALKEQEEGLSLPFVISRNEDSRIVGSTRYMNIEPRIRRLEIGTTWYSKSV